MFPVTAHSLHERLPWPGMPFSCHLGFLRAQLKHSFFLADFTNLYWLPDKVTPGREGAGPLCVTICVPQPGHLSVTLCIPSLPAYEGPRSLVSVLLVTVLSEVTGAE